MKTVNKIGDSTPPCLKPLPTVNWLDNELLNLTCIFCEIYMFIIKRKTTGHMFLERRWLNKLAYSILSKAFEASNNYI